MIENQWEYYAFISYKREDEKWAKWLQGKLESYRLPAVIRKEVPRLPQRIRPVFRDKTDLGAGNLTDSLQKELDKSKYLIVICSKQSAKSEWVGKEITSFVDAGRADRIIPFIVEGTPNSNDGEECFHPIIKEKIPEVLGINIHEIGKERAFVKVAAKLLDLRFDSLWGRFKREQRKQRLIAAAVGVACLVGLCFIGDYYREKIEYYADYVDTLGIPKGVVKLEKSQVEKRERHYRFVSTKNKLRKVVFANSAGEPVDHSNTEYADRPAIQELVYIEMENRLSTTELKDAKDKTIATYLWGEEDFTSVDIKPDKYVGSAAALASSFTSMSNLFDEQEAKAMIRRFKLTRNEHGYVISKEFKRDNGDDEIEGYDADGVSGFAYDLDSLGRPIEMRYLGYDSTTKAYFPSPNKMGVMGRKYEYDKYGNISRVEYFGKDNKAVLNEQLWAIGLSVSDERGNIIEKSFFGGDSNLCLHKDGYAKRTAEYDKRGNITEVAYFGVDGELCLNKYGYAKWTAEYDKRGNIIEVAYFGVDGERCLHKDGYAKRTAKRDERGNAIEDVHFGSDGKLCLNKDGYAKRTAEYDKRGNMIEDAYFGVDGKLCLQKNGFAKRTAKYDKRGNRIEVAFFGVDGKPCLQENDYAKWTAKYDKRGNIIEQSHFGVDGKPCLDKDGVATWATKHDEHGNRTEEVYFGIDGELCLNKYGYAKWTAEYDKRGNIIEEFVSGIDDKLCLHKDGYAKRTAKHDERGNRIEVAYFGVDGELCLQKKGFAKLAIKYDERGNIIEQSHFGVDGELCLPEDSIAKMMWKYDERGNGIEQSFFGIDGNLCLSKEGFAKSAVKYDERGNGIEESYFGVDGKLCLHKDGYAKWVAKYDERGNKIEMSYFGVDGNPSLHKESDFAKWAAKYDERGNIIEMSYFGIDGNPSLHKESGFAKSTRVYNDANEKTDWKHYGKDYELLAATVTVFVVQEGAAAHQKGLRDELIVVLEYCDWKFGDTYSNVLKTIADNREKEKRLVILNTEVQIVQYNFGKGPMSGRFDFYEISGELYSNIEKLYNEWKQSH